MRPTGQYAATSRMDIAQVVSDFSKTHPSPLCGSLDQLSVGVYQSGSGLALAYFVVVNQRGQHQLLFKMRIS
jgi:hypothetical protein